MDAKTLEALKASIAKWERNAEISKLDSASMGVSSCPLCALYHHEACIGCPVMDAGHRRCVDTPYDVARRADDDNSLVGFKVAARAEVEFLKSLLPTGENA